MGVNKIILVGRLGQKPELLQNDEKSMTRFTLATNENFPDGEGGYTEKVEWHKVVVFGKRATACNKYLSKGSQVYIEGKNATRSYTKDNQTHYITEVQVRDIQFLNAKDKVMGKTILQKHMVPEKSNPKEHFIRAQEAWNQVYGRAISDKRNYRALCFVLALVLLGAIAGLTWQGSQSKVIPYVVVLDKAGQELHTGIASKSSTSDIKIFKKELGSFVKKNRLASVDRQLMLQNIKWTYAHLLPSTTAYKKINAYFKKNNPFELISRETRIVDKINSILPVTDNTWAMEWQETRRNTSDGDIIETAEYKAILTVLKKAPETEEQWDHNPFGIWIIDFEWEKKL